MANPRVGYIRVEHGERIDQPDFQHAVFRSQVDGLMQLVGSILIGEDRPRGATETAQPRHAIVKGFAITNPSAKLVRVDGGIAILGLRDESVIKYGGLVTDPVAKTIDTAPLPASTSHGVFIRAQFEDTNLVNRIFWNATAATPIEIAKSIATRLTEAWEMKIAVQSPGDEWVKIADVVPATLNGTGAGITDRRNLLFEGRADASVPFGAFNQDWGGVDGVNDDRSTDRATYGVFGFFRWIRMVNRQIQDIIGVSRAQSAIPTGNDLNSLGVSRLHHLGRAATAGPTGMSGHLDPAADNTHDLGQGVTTLRRWRDLFTRTVQLGAAAIDTAVNARIARLDIPVFHGATTSEYTRLLTSANTNAAELRSQMNIYRRRNGETLIVTNAAWNGTSWTSFDPLVSSGVILFSSQEVSLWQHVPADGASWADTFAVGGTAWRSRLLIDNTTGSIERTTLIPIAKAQAMLDFNGAGAVTILGAQNVSTAAINSATQRLELTFPTVAFASDRYTALAVYAEGSLGGHTLHQMTATQTQGFITFESRTPAGAIANQLNTYSGRIVFAAFG